MDDNIRYLNLLAAFHIIVGAVVGLFSCIPLLNLSMSLSMLSEIPKTIAQGYLLSPFVLFQIMFIIIPIGAAVFGWMFAIAIALNGYYIKNRKWRTYCLVVGGVESIFMPFGTVLGVFTIVLFNHAQYKESF